MSVILATIGDMTVMKTMTLPVTPVAQARDELSAVLRRFRAGDTAPVVLGSHRKPEAVIVPFSWHAAAVPSPTVGAPTARASTPSSVAEPHPITLDDLRRRARLVERLASLAHLQNVRVTGSVARGTATADSDIDLIVDPLPEASLLDLAQFADDLEQLFDRPVDVLSARALDPDTDASLLADAVAL
jgi:predicted nucleotidyltransferase